jgi:acyl-CoA dehydrogenase
MDFSFSQDQQQIREAILRLCERFGDEYWLEKDKAGGYPFDFHQALAEAG